MLLLTQADMANPACPSSTETCSSESTPRDGDIGLTRADIGEISLHFPLLAWPSGPTGRTAERRQRWLRGRRGSGAQAGGCQATATRIRPVSGTEGLDEHRFQPNVGALLLAEPCFFLRHQGQEGFSDSSLWGSGRPPWRTVTIVWVPVYSLLPSSSVLSRGDHVP